jgi:hypothetical protein
MKGNRVIKDQCTCMKTVYDTNRWNEGFQDDILNDMMMNAQKFDDFLINITEHENSVDECVEQLSILLAYNFEQYTKTEFKFTERCEYCVYNSNRVSNTKVDKPWITEDCENLYRQYKH